MSIRDRNIVEIGNEMVVAGLPAAFVLRVLELAGESEGVEDLVRLWAEAPDSDEREEVEAELHEALEDREGGARDLRIASAEQADRLLATRLAWKQHLRKLVEDRGGVSAVARRAEMPQPSLSRLLNTPSEPRPATLARLATAMELTVKALRPRASRQVSPTVMLAQPYMGTLIGTLIGICYGSGRKRSAVGR